MELKGKVAVITGSARGIGKSIAKKLGQNGATVVISDLAIADVSATVDELRGEGIDAFPVEVNVTNMASVEAMFDKVMEQFGKVDILVNNAGITRDALLVRMDESDWDSVLAVNLKGTFNCTKCVAKIMMKQRNGKIVNIASVMGLIGNVGQANYSASKAGVIGLTKSAAKELGRRNINVNAVAPGFIQTKMTEVLPEKEKEKILELIPLGCIGYPEDVADAVVFLVSDSARYITGQVIQIDGGMVM
ncbi:TPA: 3-oxoacyl-[acyl-carrier-protein] reductase [bacterium]|nr:3-oxoacyl-[acyl-carrier-protein] reductase [bacterium]